MGKYKHKKKSFNDFLVSEEDECGNWKFVISHMVLTEIEI